MKTLTYLIIASACAIFLFSCNTNTNSAQPTTLVAPPTISGVLSAESIFLDTTYMGQDATALFFLNPGDTTLVDTAKVNGLTMELDADNVGYFIDNSI